MGFGLADRKQSQERWASRKRMRASLLEPFGNFLAGLCPWDWFVNPITFREEVRSPDMAMEQIGEWLADIEAHAGRPVGWVIAEEFGALGGRWHCHGLIHGTSALERRFWWREAFRRFGRTRIEPFDPDKAGAFYAAKYAAKSLGAIHFGGTLDGNQVSHVIRPDHGRRLWADSMTRESRPVATHSVAAPSANMERSFFRLGLGRWHR